MQHLYYVVPPTLTLLIISTIATLYFNIINYGQLKLVYSQCWTQKKMWLAIMTTILIMWFCSTNGPGLLGAASFRFCYFSWLGVIGFSSAFLGQKHAKTQNLISAALTIILILILVYTQLYEHLSQSTLAGFVLAFIGGTTTFVYFKQSKILLKRTKLSSSQILSVRFYLCIIVFLPLLFVNHASQYLNIENISLLFLSATLSLIIPLYCVQKALTQISSEQNAIIISSAPLLTAFIQELVFSKIPAGYLLIYIAYSLILGVNYYLKHKNIKLKRNQT